MIVWGIDPDTKNITVARGGPNRDLEWEVISGGKERTAAGRFETLLEGFNSYLQRRHDEHSLPDYVYVEKPMFTINPAATIAQALVIGAIRACLMISGIPDSLVDPGVWKKALLGTGKASKEEIKAWAKTRFDMPDNLPQDVYDAAAIVAWGMANLT